MLMIVAGEFVVAVRADFLCYIPIFPMRKPQEGISQQQTLLFRQVI